MGSRLKIPEELRLTPVERRELERQWVRTPAAYEPVEDPDEDPAARPAPIPTATRYFD